MGLISNIIVEFWVNDYWLLKKELPIGPVKFVVQFVSKFSPTSGNVKLFNYIGR